MTKKPPEKMEREDVLRVKLATLRSEHRDLDDAIQALEEKGTSDMFTIRRLKKRADEVKQDELQRLLNKLGELDPRQQNEVERSFDRLVNKLLHPPLESLRDEAQSGAPHGLLEALKRLFQLHD